MMLIDADVIIEEAHRQGKSMVTVELLENMPTADVIPIEWIKEQKDKCFSDSITAIELKHLLEKWERREDERNK